MNGIWWVIKCLIASPLVNYRDHGKLPTDCSTTTLMSLRWLQQMQWSMAGDEKTLDKYVMEYVLRSSANARTISDELSLHSESVIIVEDRGIEQQNAWLLSKFEKHMLYLRKKKQMGWIMKKVHRGRIFL